MALSWTKSWVWFNSMFWNRNTVVKTSSALAGTTFGHWVSRALHELRALSYEAHLHATKDQFPSHPSTSKLSRWKNGLRGQNLNSIRQDFNCEWATEATQAQIRKLRVHFGPHFITENGSKSNPRPLGTGKINNRPSMADGSHYKFPNRFQQAISTFADSKL